MVPSFLRSLVRFQLEIYADMERLPHEEQRNDQYWIYRLLGIEFEGTLHGI